MPRVHTRRILIGDVDSAGIAYTGRIVPMALEALELGLFAVGCDFAALICAGRISVPVVHLDADFHSPMRHGDDIAADLRCERIGERSYSMLVVLSQAHSGVPTATVRVVAACIDVATQQAISVPDDLRRRLEALIVTAASPEQPAS